VSKWRLVAAVTLVTGIALFLTWSAALPPAPRLVDQVDRPMRRESAPIIVVGVLVSDTVVRTPVPMRSDPKYPLQLRKLVVDVENVLRGAPIPEIINVYYFGFAGAFDGPRPLGFWRLGDRRILWLRRDSGVLRTACDGWDGCTEGVWSGAHVGYRPDQQNPLQFSLVDFHLTRGTGTVNKIAFATEVSWQEPTGVPGLEEYAIEKLRYLALTEQDEIKSSACGSLWLYTVDRVKLNIKRDAKDAMDAAQCRCTDSDGHCD